MFKLVPAFVAAIMLIGAVPGAEANTSRVIRLHSSDLLNQGIRALRQGEMERAITALNRFLEEPATKRNRVVAHNNLCIAYQYIGDLDAASEQCSLAIELNPKYIRAYVNRGDLYSKSKMWGKALSDYNKAINFGGKNIKINSKD